MSLVGPRPCLPKEFVFFSEAQRERFKALPGLTGSWQVSRKSPSTFSEMNALDVDYVRQANLKMDIGIILRTPAALAHQMSQAIRHRGATHRDIRFEDEATDHAPASATQRLSQAR